MKAHAQKKSAHIREALRNGKLYCPAPRKAFHSIRIADKATRL
jgi:hypothetical protein